MSVPLPEQSPIPTPEETLQLTRELLARSRATLAEVSRRLAADMREDSRGHDEAMSPGSARDDGTE